jgi:hypothetical protein
MTVRAMLKDILAEMRKESQTASYASALLVRVTGVYSKILDEVRAADIAYNAVELAALSTDQTANAARIRARATPEYVRVREAKDAEKAALEAMRSLRKYIQAKQDETRPR